MSDARPPLDAVRIARDMAPLWTRIEVVDETDSTNADLLAAADYAPHGAVRAAELQRAGRGRLQRHWSSPTRAGLTFSVLLRPRSPQTSWGWVPLLTGLAVEQSVRELAQSPVSLKWPNDVLVGAEERKVAGILAQGTSEAVVVGIGINVSTTRDELPVESATSLALAGAGECDRTVLLVAVLDAFAARYEAWERADGDARAAGLAADYSQHCSTLGRLVTLQIAGEQITGEAREIDSDGRLVVATADGEITIAAGDVEHVRLDPRANARGETPG